MHLATLPHQPNHKPSAFSVPISVKQTLQISAVCNCSLRRRSRCSCLPLAPFPKQSQGRFGGLLALADNRPFYNRPIEGIGVLCSEGSVWASCYARRRLEFPARHLQTTKERACLIISGASRWQAPPLHLGSDAISPFGRPASEHRAYQCQGASFLRLTDTLGASTPCQRPGGCRSK